MAFSGGVDSTFLLAVARQTLGENVVAATSSSLIHPSRETETARRFTRDSGIKHIIFGSDEMSLPEFVSNPADRCYHCKGNLVKSLFDLARDAGVEHVAHGANMDDLKDYRPGFKAADEAGMIAPLIDARLHKSEIRLLAKEMGLSIWDKPAMACLASRIPYGEEITREKLEMVAQAEDFLEGNGFAQFRVRHHGSVARIEVKVSEIGRLVEPHLSNRVIKRFRQIGFSHIAVDLEGYISGSLNRILKDKGKKE